MAKKGFNFCMNIIFVLLFIGSIIFTIILHSGWAGWDSILCVLMIWIFLGTIRLAFQSIREAFSKERNYRWLMKICISLTVMFALALEIQIIFVPIVTSDLIEINYDLSQMRGNKLEINNPAGKFIITKINNGQNYRIYFPRRIKQINNLETSYDIVGKPPRRVHWREGSDFNVKDNYVESRHVLGADNNEGKGRHMIVYRYRLIPWEFLKNPTRILIDMFK